MLYIMTHTPLPVAVPREDAERGLAERAWAGDRSALSELLRSCSSDVVRLCHYLAGPVDGHDTAQEALTRMVTRIDQFDPARGSFRSWALAVARNLCRDKMRRRGLERATFVGDGDEHAAAVASPGGDPLASAVARQEMDAMQVALQSLPENMRTALVLFHVSEATYEEIAESLDVPLGTVMTWLHRGRKRLRQALEEA